jgi:hypothetical protein
MALVGVGHAQEKDEQTHEHTLVVSEDNNAREKRKMSQHQGNRHKITTAAFCWGQLAQFLAKHMTQNAPGLQRINSDLYGRKKGRIL